MTEEEAAMAEERLAQTGLSKAEFGRQALTTGNVISRINSEDRELMQKISAELSYVHADIERIVHICEKSKPEKALKRIKEVEDKFTDIYNFLLMRLG